MSCSTSASPPKLFMTPLYDAHCRRQAQMTPFGGWWMPIQYTSIIKEHHHTRTNVSVFDTCHMGEFYLKGPEVCQDLDHLVTSDIVHLAIGQCRYGFLLNIQGKMLDDTIVYRLGDTEFMMVVNAATREKDAAWVQNHLSDSTRFSDRSDKTAKIDIQGPFSLNVLEKVLKDSLSSLGYFRFQQSCVGNVDILISRTGYTGELGFELYFPSHSAPTIWQTLLDYPGVLPAGLGARDTLRLEVGYPLYGQDLSETLSPKSARMMRFVDKHKSFIGKTALDQESNTHILTALIALDRRSPRHNDAVMDGDKNVGWVTSGSFSPSLKKGIALAYIENMTVRSDVALEVQNSRTRIPVRTTTLPFYTEGSAKK